jgi:hypothetical protein
MLLGGFVFYAKILPHDFILVGDESMLSLGKKGNDLWMSAKLFDSQGIIVVEIVENQFFLNKDNYFRIDRTPNRLVVYSKEAIPVIDLEYLNPTTFRLSGNWFIRNKTHLIASKDALEIDKKKFPATSIVCGGSISWGNASKDVLIDRAIITAPLT